MQMIQIRNSTHMIAALSVALTVALVVAGCRADHTEARLDGGLPPDGGGSETLSADDLAGWWVVECDDGATPAVYGTAHGEVRSSGEVRYEVELSDQTQVTLDMTPGAGDELAGRWDGTSVTFTSVPDAGVLRATAPGCGQLTLFPADTYDGEATGAWSRAVDGRTAIVATDLDWGGYTVAFSVLDENGDWPEDDQHGAAVDLEDREDPRAWATGLVALLFDGGTRQYVCISEGWSAAGCHVWAKASTPHSLNGLWLGGVRDTQYSSPTEWEATVLVEHDGSLYVHRRIDSFLDSPLWPSLRADAEVGPDGTTQYRDTTWGGSVSGDWVVRQGPDAQRLVGAYEGFDPGYYYSLERTVQPPAGHLTTDASSLSLDWFDAPMGIPEPVVGSARITQTGDQLTIVDRSGDGEVYHVQARWTGHQYEGVWWPEGYPDQTSPWRGQLNAGGWYLHGTWEKGEYSFLLGPIGDENTAANVPPGTAVVSLDPFEDTFATVEDPVTGYRYVLKRSQDRLSQIRTIAPGGITLVVDVDERMRPTRSWVDSDGDGWADEELSFQWSADSETLLIIDEINLTQTTVQLDWSDAALQANLADRAQQTGEDLGEYQQWLVDNPGRLGAILRGEEAVGSLLPPLLAGQLVKNHPAPWDFFKNTIGLGLTLYGLVKLCIAAAAAASTLGYFGVFLVFYGAYLIALFLVIMWVWYSFICDPCTLACFINCTDE